MPPPSCHYTRVNTRGTTPHTTHTSMIKQIAIAVAAATTLFAAAPAMASTPRYWSFAGHDGTAVDNGSGRYDYLTLSGAAGRTQIKVLCTGNGGNEWSAWGTTNQGFNQAAANQWCSSY